MWPFETPQTPLKELTALPRPPSWIQEKGEREGRTGRDWKRGKEGKEEEKGEDKGRERGGEGAAREEERAGKRREGKREEGPSPTSNSWIRRSPFPTKSDLNPDLL